MNPVLNNEFFRRLCEGLGFICIAVDRDLQILFWNEQAAKYFGRPPADMEGQSILEVLSEADREIAAKLFEESIASKQPREMEVKYPLGGGHKTSLVMIISPVLDDDGECIAASAGMRDITQRKRLSQELSESRRMASLGRVAGGVAHHFNNILGGMLTSIDYVLTSDSPRELRKTLRLLAQAIGRATRITNQLAAFAASENELVEWAELNNILDSFVERVSPKLRAAQLNLETHIESLESDPYEKQRLLTVLDSIAQNAIEAMAPGGTLTVSLMRDEDSAVLRLRDTGAGIPEDLMEHIFEPFFTTKGERTGGDGENIGLGLAAVHGLVAETGGTTELSSKAGEGTEVTIRLPLQRKKPAS